MAEDSVPRARRAHGPRRSPISPVPATSSSAGLVRGRVGVIAPGPCPQAPDSGTVHTFGPSIGAAVKDLRCLLTKPVVLVCEPDAESAQPAKETSRPSSNALAHPRNRFTRDR